MIKHRLRHNYLCFLGFTLLELLVVIAIVGILAGLLLPALTRAKHLARTAHCLSNKKQIMLAYKLYVDDNEGHLPQNGDRLSSEIDMGLRQWVKGWVDFRLLSVNTNYHLVANPKHAQFGAYIGYDSWTVYKCTEDNFLTPEQKALGWKYRVRNVGMNIHMGDGIGFHKRNAKSAVTSHGKLYRRMAEIKNPATKWIFIDQHPGNLLLTFFSPPGIEDDGRIGIHWRKAPSSLHSGGATIAFMDGRAELHKWDPSEAMLRPVPKNLDPEGSGRAALADAYWMVTHATDYDVPIRYETFQ